MKFRKTNEAELDKALEEVNKIYDGNIEWNNPYSTLRVKDSHGPGARLGVCLTSKGNRRHLINACWHVHGEFFDALFAINPEAYVIVAGNQRIDIDGGNWIDRNIGSLYKPLYYSEACDCQ